MGPPRHNPLPSLSSTSFLLLGSPPLIVLSSLLLFLLFSPTVVAENSADWTVRPSNSSADISWIGHSRFLLNSSQLQLSASVILAPLTQALVNLTDLELTNLRITGSLVDVDATNSLSLSSQDIAVISCDSSAYPGNLDASATVRNVLTAQQKAAAVILYSASATHCSYSPSGSSVDQYDNVFTVLNKALSTQLISLGNGSSTIYPKSTNMSFIASTSNQVGSTGDSPNTAMIILYTITGIITALFLAIIITGAVRAHRHPERYGPRHTAGRPRQSRARGIARAMLDTIPIVKFGDNNEHDGKTDAAKGDVEMGMGSETQSRETLEEGHEPTTVPATRTTDRTDEVSAAVSPHSQETPGTAPHSTDKPRSTAPDAGTTTDYPNFACPICTDDFVKGQDLRVLPCNHQFHPECIDPWLVNVSGTCPLCRIDLNPAQPEGEEGQGAGDSHAETSPEMATSTPAAPEGNSHQHRHRRLSSYLHHTLNARRMRDASVEERLAALRSVREETTRQDSSSGPAEENDEHRRRRNGLTKRLRDRFRVRTRAHGMEPTPEESVESSPAAAAAAAT
ncbi:RING-H2 finger protein [Aspergillus saccharolyticus JOP 1030-1]|uniref:RING-type domain-containing protein n=1 Tax=Aspergillus saccharolyticus JOP 1030-1 TaxID=1450539 RepID=A0A318ZUF7_9EURO|nr:hypothetical protein BP01DRAFT_354841 [Aspergillus saccharolyticus JOP 1030-1]PYH47630.1 hypothetical protein BP01DRAFT_354841 [Aspergillus saccharolyticus JOP 1030-1]